MARERTTRTSWHALPAPTVASELSVDPAAGLTETEVAKRRAEHGPNAIPDPPRDSAWKRLASQFADPLVGALLVAAIVAAIVATSEGGSYADTIAILLIVIVNAALGFFQERRAEQALDALRHLAAPRAKVLRDGVLKDLDAKELVPGDVIELDAGDSIPADARLLRSAELAVEEAALTGESVPVGKKHDAEVEEEAPVADRPSMVFTGTVATRGHARAVVVATGEHTELGRIGALISQAGREATPLEQRLARLGNAILIACLVISVIVFAIGFIRHTASIPVLLLTAVSLAVAAIPEGLPAITTITLALGMQRMARRGAIVRLLPAVETLGSATIICSDKTGTLTQNEMTVRAIETVDGIHRVTGEGYESAGEIRDDDARVEVRAGGVLDRLLTAAVLCNEAHLEDDDGSVRVVGDPTEAALLVLGKKGGVTRERLAAHYTRERELPFDSDRKRMSVIVRRDDGVEIAFVKGSPDAILALSTHVATDEGVEPLDADRRRALTESNERHASEALRVLALAEREHPDAGDPEKDLVFLGFAAMMDPPRAEATQAIAECRKAGILVTMITGDHKLTAVAIAKELGLWSDDALALTGQDLLEMDDAALEEVAPRVRVFARVTAEQKLRIVRALGARGHVVSMTGDGVNDAPALRDAPIGVAMGRTGTDVARQAAEMVLADDNFATIVHAVREGRAIFANIQKFIFFLGSSNAGLVFMVLATSFIDDIPALTPLQLLWINLVTNGLPALALGIDPPEPGQMKQGPRPKDQGIVGWRDLWGVIFVGAIMLVAALTPFYLIDADWAFVGVPDADRPLEARTMAFTILALSPLFHAFNCRSQTESIFVVGFFGNRFLWTAVGVSAAVHLITIFVPPLRPLFLTHALGLEQWGLIVALSFAPLPLVEIAKAIERALPRRAVSPSPT